MICRASLSRTGGAAVRAWLVVAGLLAALHVSTLRDLPVPGPVPEELNPDNGVGAGAVAPETGRPAAPGGDVGAGDPTPAETGSLTEFKTLLLSGDYDAAVDRYERLYDEAAVEDSAVFRESLLDHASSLIQSGEPRDASDLLDRYLSIFYADVEALVLSGRSHRDQQQRIEAIEAFQRAYQFEYRPGVRELIMNQANNIIGELVQELRLEGRPGDIVALYEHLTGLQGAVPGYFIGLANAYAQQRRYNDAIRTLDAVRHDAVVGAQARALIDKISALRSES